MINAKDDQLPNQGESNAARREQDLAEYIKGARALEELMGLEGLTSNDPAEAAKAIEAFGVGYKAIQESLGNPVDDATLQAKTADIARGVAQLHQVQGESTFTGMWGPWTQWRLAGKNCEAWTAEQLTQYSSAWAGVIKPRTPAVGAPSTPTPAPAAK